MSARDPGRLLEPGSGIDPRMRRLLLAGRDEQPDEAQLQRIAERLGPAFAQPVAEPAQPHGPSSALPLAGAAGLATVALIAAVLWASNPERAPREVEPQPAPPPAQQPAPRARAADSADEPRAAATELAADAGVPSALGPSGTTARREPKARRTSRPQRPRASDQPAASAADPIEELSLLDQAQRALAADPAQALARTDRHRERFPDGQYVQEREVIAIDALLALQRFEPALRRARAFLERFPQSSYRTRVRGQLERATAGETSPTQQ